MDNVSVLVTVFTFYKQNIQVPKFIIVMMKRIVLEVVRVMDPHQW